MTNERPDDYTVTVRREIAAAAEVLFDAWLDPESLASWFRPANTRETRAEADPRVGGSFRIVMIDDEDSSTVHTGTYREIDRPHRLVFTWSSASTGFRDTIVTVTFEASSNSSTVVEINQVGLPDKDEQMWHYEGWSDILRQLESAKSSTRTEGNSP